jgi:hypothetical protein
MGWPFLPLVFFVATTNVASATRAATSAFIGGFVDVKSFGARGDGTGDDLTAINVRTERTIASILKCLPLEYLQCTRALVRSLFRMRLPANCSLPPKSMLLCL